jgi:putative transposase
MPKWRQWESSSEADWTLALERECVVRPLAESGRPTKEGLQLAMVQLGLGRSVLYKLLRRYRQRPQTSSLLPWKRGRGSDVRRLTHEREELLLVLYPRVLLKTRATFRCGPGAGSQAPFL